MTNIVECLKIQDKQTSDDGNDKSEDDGTTEFKLSTSENGTSVLPSTGVSGGTPNNFQIKRQDAVHQQHSRFLNAFYP